MRCIVFFGSCLLLDFLFFSSISFFSYLDFCYFYCIQTWSIFVETRYKRKNMALLWVYYCQKMFCKNFDDDIRNKLLKMGVVMSPFYNLVLFIAAVGIIFWPLEPDSWISKNSRGEKWLILSGRNPEQDQAYMKWTVSRLAIKTDRESCSLHSLCS